MDDIVTSVVFSRMGPKNMAPSDHKIFTGMDIDQVAAQVDLDVHVLLPCASCRSSSDLPCTQNVSIVAVCADVQARESMKKSMCYVAATHHRSFELSICFFKWFRLWMFFLNMFIRVVFLYLSMDLFILSKSLQGLHNQRNAHVTHVSLISTCLDLHAEG